MKKLLLFFLLLFSYSLLWSQNSRSDIHTHSPQKDSYYLNNELVEWEYLCVSPDGNGDGSSWQNPSNLADALRWAYLMEKQGTGGWFGENGSLKIYIKEGTYKPKYASTSTSSDVLEAKSDMRQATFLMVNNVELYGGFSGFELDFESRTGSVARTILSGDHSGNDTRYDFSMPHDQIIAALNRTEDNSYHVITVNENLNKLSLHDLTITGGGNQTASGSDEDGAGLRIINSSILVVNCIFRDNYADMDGGAVYIDVNSTNSNNEQTFIGSVFHHNFSWECGSAIFANNYANVKIIGSTVAANSSYRDANSEGGRFTSINRMRN